MAGVDPGPALASVAAGRRAFLITSQTNPNALVEVSGGVPAEFPVMTMPRLYGLSAAGNDVWVLTRSDAGALERRRLSGGPFDGGLLGPPDEVNPSFSGTVADVFTSPDGREAAAGVDEATSLFQYRLQDPFSSTWGPAGELTFPSANTVVGVRGAWLGPLPGQPVWLTVDSMGVLRIDGEAPFPATRFTHTLSMSAAPFVDAVRFGNAVLVAWVTFGGELRLSLMSTVLASPPVDVLNAVGQTRWNDTEPAVSPRLTLMDGEVLLTWSVGMGAGPWRLKARTLR
jgi:hypothetical protein